MLKAIARPKVNLFLHVTGRRADGYHLLDSLVAFPDGGDEISVTPHRELTLKVVGPFSGMIGASDDNLILKAARLLQKYGATVEGAEINLEKNLPVAAGIGGGSADAAVMLQLLNGLWRLDFSPAQLAEIGSEIGADVPSCLLAKPALMSGIGEKLQEIRKFPKIHILLVNSGIMVSTGDVFKRLSIGNIATSAFDLRVESAKDLVQELRECRNDLQGPALELAPEIGDVLSAIEGQEGCQLARMSGSGGTCFGLFETAAAAEAAAQYIQTGHPDWWVLPTMVGR
ncbi:MAG: 4-(cytidine 5'-diphospho)-2-C-methyl-D-erythritol kinase [Sneathiella sp.]|nr:4-(cytidine 5'-diphospho)-2-C-methyl-D-erythritol kinase [Sneathiella sp.]